MVSTALRWDRASKRFEQEQAVNTRHNGKHGKLYTRSQQTGCMAASTDRQGCFSGLGICPVPQDGGDGMTLCNCAQLAVKMAGPGSGYLRWYPPSMLRQMKQEQEMLTGVYNRSQYEKDLHSLSHSNYRCITCLYLDTLGSMHYHTAIGVQTADHPSGLAAAIHNAELAMRKAKE